MEGLFFVASKLFWLAARPLTLGLALLAAGTLLVALGRRRAGLRTLAVTLAVLVGAEYTTASTELLRALENRFPPLPTEARAAAPPPAGIIVLGGATEVSAGARGRDQVLLNDAAERMTEAVALARRHPDAVVAFTGGAGQLGRAAVDPAALSERLFLDLGIAPDRLLIEPEARNTWENAVLLKAMVDPQPGQRWLLVTSAWHMPRSMGIFRRVGWEVEPWPVDYRSPPWPVCCLRPGGGLADLETGVRELIGLIAYRLSGRTDALVPSP